MYCLIRFVLDVLRPTIYRIHFSSDRSTILSAYHPCIILATSHAVTKSIRPTSKGRQTMRIKSQRRFILVNLLFTKSLVRYLYSLALVTKIFSVTAIDSKGGYISKCTSEAHSIYQPIEPNA